ncbi:MAG: class I SAM-dependent methyltransferase [bacterium]
MKSHSDPTQLVLRNQTRFEGRKLLVVDPPSIGAVFQMARSLEIRQILTRDYGLYMALGQTESSPSGRSFSLLVNDNAEYDTALVFVPKGRELLRLTLASIASQARPGTEVYVVGGNRTGIKGAPNLMKEQFGAVRKIDTARHCQMLGSVMGSKESPAVLVDEWTRTYRTEGVRPGLTIVSLPGVFSHGAPDDGSDLLMAHWQPQAPRRILDVGCGSGVLGATLAAMYPQASVVMIDNHAAALESARRTVAANDIRNVEILPSDLFGQVSGRFDLIVSNPPFHSGHESDHVTPYQMIEQAAAHLEPGGSLQIVSNTFLPYAEALRKVFSEVLTLHMGRRYRVYLARGPHS